MFDLYDVVRLKSDDIEHGVKTTYMGAIIDISKDKKRYAVEFVDENGDTVEDALFTDYETDELVLVMPFSQVKGQE